MVERREQLQKMLSFKYTPLDQDLFDKLARLDAMYSWLSPKAFKVRMIERDTALAEMEKKKLQKELVGVEREAKKLEKESTVKCPKCGEVFQWHK